MKKADIINMPLYDFFNNFLFKNCANNYRLLNKVRNALMYEYFSDITFGKTVSDLLSLTEEKINLEIKLSGDRAIYTEKTHGDLCLIFYNHGFRYKEFPFLSNLKVLDKETIREIKKSENEIKIISSIINDLSILSSETKSKKMSLKLEKAKKVLMQSIEPIPAS